MGLIGLLPQTDLDKSWFSLYFKLAVTESPFGW